MLFPSNMVHSTGKAFVKSLSDCLWVVDGHHDTLQKQSCPIPGEDGHYKTFEQLLGSSTDESYRPSLQSKAKRTKMLLFTASVQHVKNVNLMLQCDECNLWRLLLTSQTNYKGTD